MLKAPGFWYRPFGLRALLLTPFSWVYGFFAMLTGVLARPYRAEVPVISVGNIVIGGAGKTPTALALAKILQSQGFNPAFVSRGYGGAEKGPVQVSLDQHSFREVGDEPLLLARVAPTYVAKRRRQGVMLAQEKGADVIILDDGHQNCDVKKDFSLVVVNAAQKFGNGMLLPAGPLREPLAKGMDRADAIVFIGDGEYEMNDLPVFRAKLQPKPFPYSGKRIVAFCGLAFPGKFKETLLHLGCKLDKFVEFPDHYPYSESDISAIIDHAYGIPLVTTAKDFSRVPQIYDHMIHVVEIELVFEDPAGLVNFFQ